MIKNFLRRARNFLIAPLNAKLDLKFETLIMLQAETISRANLARFNMGGVERKNRDTSSSPNCALNNSANLADSKNTSIDANLADSNCADSNNTSIDANLAPSNLTDSKVYLESMEFRAFSQNGEDGILDFLIEILGLDSEDSSFPRAFIEFGVENYRESNTRYLLFKRNWQGFVMDGSSANINFIRKDYFYWKYDLEAKCAFITRENINELIDEYLRKNGLSNVALLSIDIDGMDYFIFEALKIKPAIIVIEYNALLPHDKSVSVPYRADFNRYHAHPSGLYFGASSKAMINLAKSKGYIFVGGERSGTNLFFVRENFAFKLERIATHSLEDYSNRHRVRQSRDKNFNLTFERGKNRYEIIKDLPLVEFN